MSDTEVRTGPTRTTSTDPADAPARGGPSWVVAAVVVSLLLLVASAGVLVWSAVAASGSDGSDRAQQAQATATQSESRREVLAAAQSFFVESNNYDVRAIADYQDRVHPLLTPEFTTTFDTTVDEVLSELRPTKLVSQGVFRVAAIKSLDADSAEVLVAGNASAESTLVDRVFFPRWRVMLVRVDGQWLVDDYQTLVGDGGTVVGQ
jgi:Mce-associated membrane protein